MNPEWVRLVAHKDLSVPEVMRQFSVGRQPARLLRAAADGMMMPRHPEQDILVVGDQHVTPGGPTEHFHWLANMIRDRAPDVLVNVGDVIDNKSFSYHSSEAEKATATYIEELAAGVDAWLPAVHAAKDVGCKLVLTLGNHDDHRLKRHLSKYPWLRGAIKELGPMMEVDGWEVHDFQDPAYVSGIGFSHYWVSGVMGRPIGGVNAARSMAIKLLDSAIGGHSHEYHMKVTTSATGRRLLTGSAGCFIHPGSEAQDWAGPQVNKIYDRGVVYIHRASDGFGDVEWVSMDRMHTIYG